ncbi:hypothetical protein LTR49_020410 [Elasticomyces elasticus]|nr:hypothetical protein LTR49_020410 [Elasticomyces elasticus]KAK5761029.1 hypothetical protein LTS12_008877 [Elasticomyces elasticus]
MSPAIRLSSKASGLRFPSLAEAPNYHDFLVKFLSIRQSSGTPAVVKKDVVDQKYEQLVRQRYKSNDSTIKRYLHDASAVQSRQAIVKWGEALARRDAAALSSMVQQLTLTRISTGPKFGRGGSDSIWEQQRYKDFAAKTIKANPDVAFTKPLMDEAFRSIVATIHPSMRNAGMEKMVQRVGVAA